VPLDEWGTDWTPPAEVAVAPGVDMKKPMPRQVVAMTPETFFGRLNALLPANPAYPADAPVMERIAALGVVPDAEFPWASFAPEVQHAITAGVEAGKQAITPSWAGWSPRSRCMDTSTQRVAAARSRMQERDGLRLRAARRLALVSRFPRSRGRRRAAVVSGGELSHSSRR
jgi:hypothetical protein